MRESKKNKRRKKGIGERDTKGKEGRGKDERRE